MPACLRHGRAKARNEGRLLVHQPLALESAAAKGQVFPAEAGGASGLARQPHVNVPQSTAPGVEQQSFPRLRSQHIKLAGAARPAFGL